MQHSHEPVSFVHDQAEEKPRRGSACHTQLVNSHVRFWKFSADDPRRQALLVSLSRAKEGPTSARLVWARKHNSKTPEKANGWLVVVRLSELMQRSFQGSDGLSPIAC